MDWGFRIETLRRLSDRILARLRRILYGVLCRLGLLRLGPTTVILVRHADVPSGVADPALNDAGIARANELVHALGRAGITAIFTSQAPRTHQTAGPLAAHLGLTPIERPSSDSDLLAREILEEHGGETVLVIGHSNTVPAIAAALGAPWAGTITATEFDNLLWVTVPCAGHRTVHHLRYGATTPPGP